MTTERRFFPLPPLLTLTLAVAVPLAAAEPLAPEERSALKIRCAAHVGEPAAESACLAREQAALETLPAAPLDRLSPPERTELAITCAPQKPQGPAAWRRCAAAVSASYLATRPAGPAPIPPVIAAVRDAQLMLATLGYEPGPADGVIGERTRAAIERFRVARRLEPGRDVSDQLLAELHRAIEEHELAALAAARPQPTPPARADGVLEVEPVIAALPAPTPPADPMVPSAAPAQAAPAEMVIRHIIEVQPPTPSTTAPAEPTPQQLFARLAPSVFVTVAFETFDDVRSGKAMAIGSAVAIGRRTLVTNCHVVDGSGMISIGADDAIIGLVRLTARDPERDLCILEATGGLELPAITEMRGFDDLEVGERVYAIGTPSGLERTLSEGIISALRPGGSPLDRIQFTAPISPGSSGGGLFDARGRLIGVTTFVAEGQNLNFAVAVDGVGTLVPRDTGLRAVSN